MSSEDNRATATVSDYYRGLAEAARAVVEKSTSETYVAQLGAAHAAIRELDHWRQALDAIGEVPTLAVVVEEYQYAVHSATEGLYRACYSALRVCLEFALATIQFASDDIAFREWQRGARDINWSGLASEETGVMSARYACSYFAELKGEVKEFRGRSIAAYRQYSEHIHANPRTHSMSPVLQLDHGRYTAFLECLPEFHAIVNFFLFVRFARQLGAAERECLQEQVMDRIGHIPAVRAHFEM